MDRAANNLAIGQFTDEGGTPEYGLEGRCKKELELGGSPASVAERWLSTGKSRIAPHRSESSPLGSPRIGPKVRQGKSGYEHLSPG